MNIIFITYGSNEFRESAIRICKQAKSLDLFNKVIRYSQQDLPEYIINSPIFSYQRGGGYWIWKPYIIHRTLQEYSDSVVVYADAGCTLNSNYKQWYSWFEMMKNTDTILFRLQTESEFIHKINDVEYICTNKIKEWIKKDTSDYFDKFLFNNIHWKDNGLCCGGLIIANKDSQIIDDWYNLSIFRPDLFFDILKHEKCVQYNGFKEHRHDQTVLSGIAACYENDEKIVKFLPATLELNKDDAVVASRIRHYKISYKTHLISIFKKLLGTSLYNKLHLR